MLCVTLCLLCALCVRKRCSVIFFILFSFNSYSQSVIITSHRGAADFAPENTLLSIQKALEAGAKRIEIDVRMTSDSILVLMHDKKIDRTTNGKGSIYKKTYSEIENCNAGFDQKIPTLDEVLKLVDGKAQLVIDIKKGGSLFDQSLVDEIKKYKASSWCILSSFKIRVLRRMHDLDSALSFHRSMIGKIPFLPIFFGTSLFFSSISKNEFISEYNCNHAFLTKHLVEKIHKHQKKINAWTVDKRSRSKKLIKKGVDGIISNNPLILQEE